MKTGTNRLMGRAAVIAALLATAGLAAEDIDPATGHRFISAHHKAGAVYFQPDIEIHWSDLAPRRLVEADLAEPSPQLLRSLAAAKSEMFGRASFGYDAPLIPILMQRHYYWISALGISRLRLVKLTGTVDFYLSRDEEKILDRRLWGEIQAFPDPAARVVGGGFVVGGTASIDETSIARARHESARCRANQADHRDRESARPTGFSLTTEVCAFSFRLDRNGREFRFVQFAPDHACEEACCEYRYAIRLADGTESIVASNDYGCDI